MHKVYAETEYCWPSVGFEVDGVAYYAYYRKEEKFVVLFRGSNGQPLFEGQDNSIQCHNSEGWEVVRSIETSYSEWQAILSAPEILAVNFV